MRPITLPLLLLIPLLVATASAAAPELTASWDGTALSALRVSGEPLPGVSATLSLVDPRTGKPADPAAFTLTSRLVPHEGALSLQCLIAATGENETVVDAVLHVAGTSLPTGDGDSDLLLATRLLNKLPLVSLRCRATGADALAMAMPADEPYVCEFRDLPARQAVQLRVPLGFSPHAAPASRMQASLSIVLYATDPQWHFRSALAGYYRLFPRQFERVEQRDGGWFFANETRQIPNPQHYAFHEGQGNLQDDHDRNMGMFPYNETGSETIQLPGPKLPRDYPDAIGQMEALDRQQAPQAWKLNGGELDGEIKHGGRFSFRVRSEAPNASRHASQMFVLTQPISEPVTLTAWSRAEGVKSVSGNPNDYSIYIDCLLADGGYLFGQCAVFKPGTHDWEQSKWVIRPRVPLVDLRVYAMFRNHTGTAWFDDIRLARDSHPDENLLENGDFDTLGRRKDIQFVRDNALTDAEDHYRVLITDNWGSDVREAVPLSLLRFICNVNPALRNPEARPTPASRGQQFFDTLFEGNPAIDGCYIDGAGAWTCWYMSHRQDHFAFARYPLTYDAKTFKVGEHGRFQMLDWLRFIQERYRNRPGPAGTGTASSPTRPKTILGNMGPTTEAWTSYTALDIIGIESSLFRDRALMGYHRFGGYHKPVLPMNFVNLHKLDDRATAEEFVLASAQWGHFPSTGRQVREGYASYGDVCHTYFPALCEMSQAGWEPEPLCEGLRAERFGPSRGVVYFTIRAPQQGRRTTVTVLRAALAGITAPVVMDAVQLAPVPARMTPAGLCIDLVDGGEELTILRVSSADNARQWLLQRAAHHCANAAIVRGKSGSTARLTVLAGEFAQAAGGDGAGVPGLTARLQAEQTQAAAEPASLERTSLMTEIADAQRAVAEWVLFTGDARFGFEGERLVPVSETAHVAATLTPGRSGARLLGAWPAPERNILRLVAAPVPDMRAAAGQPVPLQRALPGTAHVRAALEVPLAGATPITVTRAANVHFTPVVTASVERTTDPATQAFVYTVRVRRLGKPQEVTVQARADGAQVVPDAVTLAPQEETARFRVQADPRKTTIIPVWFEVSVQGRKVAEVTSEFRNLPPPPPGQVALLSRGATVTADSSYSGYSPEVAIDGVWETSGLHWTKKAWASQDAAYPEGHWLEIKLPHPAALSQAWLYWAIDNNHAFSSRDYDIELWDGKVWQAVARVRDNPLSTVTVTSWPSQVTERVRIHQLKGGGPASRPEIMWVTEVCLYNLGTLN